MPPGKKIQVVSILINAMRNSECLRIEDQPCKHSKQSNSTGLSSYKENFGDTEFGNTMRC